MNTVYSKAFDWAESRFLSDGTHTLLGVILNLYNSDIYACNIGLAYRVLDANGRRHLDECISSYKLGDFQGLAEVAQKIIATGVLENTEPRRMPRIVQAAD